MQPEVNPTPPLHPGLTTARVAAQARAASCGNTDLQASRNCWTVEHIVALDHSESSAVSGQGYFVEPRSMQLAKLSAHLL